ncbi:MAG: 2Fe-2S iron-sulfur cluster-binding protein [Gammaproteobacteria bacterium]
MSAIVTIQSTGERFTVAAGETILHAALRQGIKLPHGCYNGVCGACISRIISGAIDYPDGPPLALFEEEAGKGLCCVGHPRGDLVIEPDRLGTDCEPWE